MDLFFTAVELGLLLSPVVIGVYLTFRVLRYPDLSVDGSLVTGAAAATLAIHAGLPGEVGVVLGFFAGLLAGSLTAFLHVTLGIEKILSGILALGMLYTINLRIMDGPNLSLLNQKTVLGVMQSPLNHLELIAVLLAITAVMTAFVNWLLSTEFGLQFRAAGESEPTARSFAINPHLVKFFGLALSGALMGLSGALAAQYFGFADINMGIGNIIFGLAAMMIGETLFSSRKVSVLIAACIIGAVMYELVINVALRLGLQGTDLKLITSLIVVIALVLQGGKQYIPLWKKHS